VVCSVSEHEELEEIFPQAEAGGCCFLEPVTRAVKPQSLHCSRRFLLSQWRRWYVLLVAASWDLHHWQGKPPSL